MVQIIDGKEYYTLEEARKISDKTIKKNAKKFADEVIAKQNTSLAEKHYV